MVSEERKTIFKKGSESKYLSVCKNQVWPSLKSHGPEVICMMRGLIGLRPITLAQITSYNDIHSWDGGQGLCPSLREQTRYAPENMGASKELWDREMSYRSRRVELTKTTKVNLMTSLDIDH